MRLHVVDDRRNAMLKVDDQKLLRVRWPGLDGFPLDNHEILDVLLLPYVGE